MHPPTGGDHSCRFRLRLRLGLLGNRLRLRLRLRLLGNRLRLRLRLGLLGNRFGLRLRLYRNRLWLWLRLGLGLGRANQAVTMGPPADAVRLSIHDAR